LVAEYATWFAEAIQTPDIKAKLAVQGLYPAAHCVADFAAYLRKEHEKYGRIIRAAGIKPE
jgi:tripartite-type tricarboxylate transporter receptor subunit TctC